jgi:hypothetical protein
MKSENYRKFFIFGGNIIARNWPKPQIQAAKALLNQLINICNIFQNLTVKRLTIKTIGQHVKCNPMVKVVDLLNKRQATIINEYNKKNQTPG